MKKKYLIAGGVIAFITAALFLKYRRSIPKGASPVKDFDKEKYLGKWFEIARLDYHYEHNLNHTTAEYFVNKDGSIKVVNTGYDYTKNETKTATGKAVFAGSDKEGKLKVSFFGPFYAGYNVIAIDEDYKYALVAGRNLDYLWLLSRERTMPEDVKNEYLSIAASIGYKTNDLTWVNQY
ncbi:lipocalin family protein [Ferruginibacter albus]|uniref:lipocalin family protein n=1 Tax=Ferruginibacter albus TaxID=2875540 RepID=UPI001CC8097A|nr:lipocalin family protein [Ferruginibacter albus]UAY51127.1 lipocalin family protein [Ferruginibacter albus]